MNHKDRDTNEKNIIPEIALIGINYKTAPVDLREKFVLDNTGLASLREKFDAFGIQELVYLSTCNRVCFYFTSQNIHHARELLLNFLETLSDIERNNFESYFYIKYAIDAVKHLFSVTASIDSMVIGENEIFHQVKEAYKFAVEHENTGVILNRLFHQAFKAAKHVKTDTDISKNPLSVAHIAVEKTRAIFDSLEERKILLIGAGEMAALIMKHFLKKDSFDITLANRTIENAQRLIDDLNINAQLIALDHIENQFRDVDIIISSVTTDTFVITKEMVQHALSKRNKPLIILDISVPRSVDPHIESMEDIYVYNIDHLKEQSEENLNLRKNELVRAKDIITEDAQSFFHWYEGLHVVPVIARLKEECNAIREQELEKYRTKKMKHFSAEDFELVSELTNQIMTKTLHNPIQILKTYYHSSSKSHIDLESAMKHFFKDEEQNEE